MKRGPQPRDVPLPDYIPRPYVFTLERRDDQRSPLRTWAIAVLDLGATGIALRLKGVDGGIHPDIQRHPLSRDGAERFFSEDLPQLGRVGAEVTRNTPSVHFVLSEIRSKFGMSGVAVFRGRTRVVVDGPISPDDGIQRAADSEFSVRAGEMIVVPDDVIPR